MPEAGGASNALVESYLVHRAMLVRIFTARLGSAAAAEDLVQDIYLRLADQTEAPVSNLAGYLYRIGWNLMLDRRRGERRASAREASWVDSTGSRVGGEAVVEEAPPEAAIDAKRGLEVLVEALEELPAQTQRIFRLHKFDGLTHGEVASRLGISRSSVEKHVSAALKHLVQAARR